MTNVSNIESLLQHYAALKQSTHSMFFKTSPGGYAEHDQFVGVSVPVVRKLAKQFASLSLEEIQCLIESKYNEERLLALFILVAQYQKADELRRDELYAFYMNNIRQVNNWNLVDSSAHFILGRHLDGKDKDILLQFAQSSNLWQRRIAIIATWHFIKKSEVELTLSIAQCLLHDSHDLIHKAVGWMLREVGQKNENALRAFLDKHRLHMPRTMLRYAIEKFSQDERKMYLKK